MDTSLICKGSENRTPYSDLIEISQAHLRMGMDPETPIPPFTGTSLDCVVAQSAERAFFTANPALTAVLSVTAIRSTSLIVHQLFS